MCHLEQLEDKHMVAVFICIGVAIHSCLVTFVVLSVHQAIMDMARIPHSTLCGLDFGSTIQGGSEA